MEAFPGAIVAKHEDDYILRADGDTCDRMTQMEDYIADSADLKAMSEAVFKILEQ